MQKVHYEIFVMEVPQTWDVSLSCHAYIMWHDKQVTLAL